MIPPFLLFSFSIENIIFFLYSLFNKNQNKNIYIYIYILDDLK